MLFVPIFSEAQSVLTIDECIEMAISNNKRIAASYFQMKSAKYMKRAAVANFFPTLSFAGDVLYSPFHNSLKIEGGVLPIVGADGTPTGGGFYFPGIDLNYRVNWGYNAGLLLRQPLFMGGQIIAGLMMGRLGEAVAFQNNRLTESEIVLETATAYANVVRAVEKNRVAVAYNELLAELKRSVEKAYERGLKSRNDVLKVDVKLNEGKLNLKRAENAKRLAVMNLCHCIGRSVTEQIAVDSNLPNVEYRQYGCEIASRPELQLLNQNSEYMRQKAKYAKGELLPKVALVAQYGYMEGVNFNGSKLFKGLNSFVGVQVTIPILNYGSHYKYRSAQMQYEKELANRDDKIELMKLEVAQAVCRLEEAFIELRLAESVCESANENLRVSRSMYNAGTESLSDHIEAHVHWLDAEQTLVAAKVSIYLCLLDYQKKSGTLR